MKLTNDAILAGGLVICKPCYRSGSHQVIGRLLPDNRLEVERYHKGKTIATGRIFCGLCGSLMLTGGQE